MKYWKITFSILDILFFVNLVQHKPLWATAWNPIMLVLLVIKLKNLMKFWNKSLTKIILLFKNKIIATCKMCFDSSCKCTLAFLKLVDFCYKGKHYAKNLIQSLYNSHVSHAILHVEDHQEWYSQSKLVLFDFYSLFDDIIVSKLLRPFLPLCTV